MAGIVRRATKREETSTTDNDEGVRLVDQFVDTFGLALALKSKEDLIIGGACVYTTMLWTVQTNRLSPALISSSSFSVLALSHPCSLTHLSSR